MPSAAGVLTFSALGFVGAALIDLFGGTFYVALSNVDPTTAAENLGDVTEIANGNGYTTGGTIVASTTWTDTGSGVWAFTGTDVLFTATGGSMATFRYAVLYCLSGSNPILLYYDYGSGVTLTSTQTFLVDFTTGTNILTLS